MTLNLFKDGLLQIMMRKCLLNLLKKRVKKKRLPKDSLFSIKCNQTARMTLPERRQRVQA